MRRILKIIASILICITIFAIVAAVYKWSIGSDPFGGFILVFLMTLFYGSWLFIIAALLLSRINSLIQAASWYIYVLAGALMGLILPPLSGINFFDIQGFPVDFIGYVISGATFGCLYYYWILRDNSYGST